MFLFSHGLAACPAAGALHAESQGFARDVRKPHGEQRMLCADYDDGPEISARQAWGREERAR